MQVHRLTIPLTVPFRTAGGEVSERDVLLIEATGTTASGTPVSGWGEAAPFPGQDEPMDVLLSEAGAGRITTTLAAGIDQASSDLAAREAGEPLVVGDATEVPISVAIGLAEPRDQVDAAVGRGVRRVKLKVAPGSTSHVADIRANHPDLVIGIDANRSFADSDLGQLYGLVTCDIAYIEEPFIVWDGRGAGRLQAAGVPLFADESISRLDDIDRLLGSGFVDGVTVKPGRLGWTGALKAIHTVGELGLRWRASGLLETGIGRTYTNLLAARPDAFISDVAPASWFLETDVIAGQASSGTVRVGGSPGIGVDPDPTLMHRYRVATYELGV